MAVFDCEGDSLYPSKFHVLTYEDEDGELVNLTTHKQMREWLVEQDVLIGHNIIRWDIPQLERVLNIKIGAFLVDTLALSWYLEPELKWHGLEAWGETFGIPKPPVVDWANEPLEVYVHRCEEDVKINSRLWKKQQLHLSWIYEDLEGPVINWPIVRYLMFKMDCARLAEKSGWRLDIPRCQSLITKLSAEKAIKVEALKGVMPKVIKYKSKTIPSKPYKKDGTLSVEGAKWFALLRREGLNEDYDGFVEVVDKEEEPNPNSYNQIKDWLFSLGWEPETFEYKREDDGSERAIPQLKKKNDPELCPSVLRLVEDNPDLSHFAGLSILNHRLSILNGFIENVDKEGFLNAEIQGFTNTLRFRHKVIVNLPGVDKPYGSDIRGCLIARDSYELVGSDMSSLEDKTKRHFMYEYDPDYVNEMSSPGYDPHLDLALTAGAVDEDQIEFYNLYKDDDELNDNVKPQFKAIKLIRHLYKTANYSAIYGVGAAKLARELKISLKEAKAILDAYWARNWSVRQLAEDQVVKTVRGQMWLYNPVSKLYYSLRYDKDRFSTLNQGTGVYCFDNWVMFFLKQRPQLTGQMHDEVILEVKKGYREEARKMLLDAIDKTNEKLKLNVTLSVGIKFGADYAEIH